MQIKSLFKNTYNQEGSQKHYYYKNSTQYISQFSFGKDARVSDHARVECLIIHEKDRKKEQGISSTLEILFQTAEFGRWLSNQ